MSKKIILDLCGGTGSWSKPYKDAGYEVIVVTLPEFNILHTDMDNKKLYFQNKDKEIEWVEEVNISDIYAILAAPPCTMFSIARTTAKTPRDLAAGMEVVEACLKVIWEVRKQNKLAFWALENPFGLLRQFLGKPAFTFSPEDFGDPYTKKTEIWGWFKEPRKKPITIPDRVHAQLAKNNRLLPILPEGYKEIGRRNHAARRAMTPPGFANAFFRSNP